VLANNTRVPRQETHATEQAAIEYIIDGDPELREVQQDIAKAEQDNNGIKQADLHSKMDIIGGYTATARAARFDMIGNIIQEFTVMRNQQ
jgi:ATPase subunit of ABC transporter with duplicated ATPase domains